MPKWKGTKAGRDPKEQPPNAATTRRASKRLRTAAKDDLLNAASAQHPFAHEPLDLSRDTIRLLEIIPGSDETQVHCRMRDSTISAEKYTCLSYTWQPMNPEHDIKVNGHAFSVGENLYQFLRSARSAGIAQPLWIDMLCINQSDVRERNHQVRRMGEIYEAAEKVLVWLGALDDEILGALAFLGDFLVKYGIDHLFPDEPDKATQCLMREAVGVHGPWLKDPIRRFLCLPYWQRIWIAQEILLAARPMLMLGTNSIDLWVIAISLCSFMKAESCGENLKSFFLADDSGDMAKKYFKLSLDRKLFPKFDGRKTPLASLLYHYRKGGCSDDRDRIFALLSLATKGHKIVADYTINKCTLFRTTMESCIYEQTIDDLLLLGASLIQSLRLRPPPSNLNTSPFFPTENGASTPAKVSIPFTSSKAIGLPVWGLANLKVMDTATQASWLPCSMVCIYVAVFDAQSRHVFEYAIQESETDVVVRYARAHEWVQGQSEMYGEPLESVDGKRFLWVNVPSEDVYYYKTNNEKSDEPPSLWGWDAPQFKFVQTQAHGITQTEPTAEESGSRIRPSPRSVQHYMPSYSLATTQLPHIFQGIFPRLKEDLTGQVDVSGDIPIRKPGLKVLPPTSRSAIYRLGNKDRHPKRRYPNREQRAP